MRNKNKKAQIGEIIEDFPSFIVIIFILFVLVLFSFVLYKAVDRVSTEKIDALVVQDRMNFMLSSLMQEKEGGISISDRLRANEESAKERITKEINDLCTEENKKCSPEILFEDSTQNCKALKNGFCFYVPGDKLITIKINY